MPWLDEESEMREAVDFHGKPRMLTDIARKHGLLVRIVRSAIWTQSSAINTRTGAVVYTADGECRRVWCVIRHDVASWQARRIRTAFGNRALPCAATCAPTNKGGIAVHHG